MATIPIEFQVDQSAISESVKAVERNYTKAFQQVVKQQNASVTVLRKQTILVNDQRRQQTIAIQNHEAINRQIQNTVSHVTEVTKAQERQLQASREQLAIQKSASTQNPGGGREQTKNNVENAQAIKSADTSQKSFLRTIRETNSAITSSLSVLREVLAIINQGTDAPLLKSIGTAITRLGEGLKGIGAELRQIFKDFSKVDLGRGGFAIVQVLGLLGRLGKVISRIILAFSQLAESANLKGVADILKVFSMEVDNASDRAIRFDEKIEVFVQRLKAAGVSVAGLSGLFILQQTGIINLGSSFGSLSKISETTRKVTGRMGTAVRDLSTRFKGLGASAKNLSIVQAVQNRSLLSVGKGYIALADATAIGGTALIGISRIFGALDNSIARAAERTALYTGLLLAGFSAALSGAIFAVGKLAIALGGGLVSANERALGSFKKVESVTLSFERVINNLNTSIGHYGEGVGSVQVWTQAVEELSEETGFLARDLQKAAVEIISVGSHAGLTSDEMQTLLEVSADYAAQQGKTSRAVSVALVSALQGATQGALALGIELKQSTVEHFLQERQTLKTADALTLFRSSTKGIADARNGERISAEKLTNTQARLVNQYRITTKAQLKAVEQQEFFLTLEGKTFNQLSENEKARVRLIKLLADYGVVQGEAAAQAQTLAGQERVLANNTDKIAASFGLGVGFIQNFNFQALALNKILKTVPSAVFAFLGILSSLLAVFLIGIGYVLVFGTTLLFVRKIFKILTFVMQAELVPAFRLFGSQVPLLSLSLEKLALRTTGVTLRFGNLRETVRTIGLLVKGLTKEALLLTLGIRNVSGGTKGLVQILRVMGSRLKVLIVFLGKGLLSALGLLLKPITLVIVAFVAIVAVFRRLEERTKALSTLWKVFSEVFNPVARLFGAIGGAGKGAFQTITDAINNLITGAARRLGVFLATSIGALIKLNNFKLNPFRNTRFSLSAKQEADLIALQKRLIDFGIDRRTRGPAVAGGGVTPAPVNQEQLAADRIHQAELRLIEQEGLIARRVLETEFADITLQERHERQARELEDLQNLQFDKLEIERKAELQRQADEKGRAAVRRQFEIQEEKLSQKQAQDSLRLDKRQMKEKRDLEKTDLNASLSAASRGIKNLQGIARQGSQEAKTLAIADATISTFLGASQALADKGLPTPVKFGLAASVVAVGLANVAKIQSTGFQFGGIVPGIPNSDGSLVRVSGGEFVATRAQQGRLLELAEGRQQPQGDGELTESIRALANRPVRVEINGRAIASAVREERRLGFAI